MKKTIALILLICMVTTAMLGSALAEASALLATTNEAGNRVFAVIYDAQGQVVAEVTDETALTTEDAGTELSAALMNVMGTVYHGEVECLLHEHDAKVDVNTVLESLAQELEAHSLVLSSLINVNLSADVAAMVPEGGCVEVKLAQDEATPLLALFTADGTNWQVLPMEAADGACTLKLPSSGMVALLCNGETYLGIGGDAKTVEDVQPGDAEEASANFTPSATGKPAPEAVRTDVDGQSSIGWIRNNAGDAAYPVPDRNYVVVTPVMDRQNAIDLLVRQHLDGAYEDMLQAADVGDLAAGGEETLAAALDALLADMNAGLTHEQLVVSELFEVSGYGEYLHYLCDENYYLEITFATQLDPASPVVVIHSPDGVNWHVHDAENMTVNADGTLTLKLSDLGTVAILVAGEYTLPADEAPVMAP